MPIVYRMPAEYEPHEGTGIIWPVRPGSWGLDPAPAKEAFLNVIRAIAADEKVWLLAGEEHLEEAAAAVKDIPNAEVLAIGTNDSWARDVLPTFVREEDRSEDCESCANRESCGAHDADPVKAVAWSFNAWGGTVDGLYADWEKDDASAAIFAEKLGIPVIDAAPFVLEGGSIHSDGQGTLMTTESCLLSAGRNPQMTKEEIEEELKKRLGVRKVLWLPRGIYNDETNEHVDNVCAFTAPGEVVLAWTDNEDDPQYALSKASLEYLENETDAKGRKIVVHKLPIPDHPVILDEDDVAGYSFEEGEDTREDGERLAASYVNYYYTNKSVLVPQFGGENEESDRRAVEILSKLCPDRKVIGIPALVILKGGGNIHCITQQVPQRI